MTPLRYSTLFDRCFQDEDEPIIGPKLDSRGRMQPGSPRLAEEWLHQQHDKGSSNSTMI